MVRLKVVLALVFGLALGWGFPAQGAETFGLDADECAIQRALLGKAGPNCPPVPEPVIEVVPEPPAPQPPPPVVAAPVVPKPAPQPVPVKVPPSPPIAAPAPLRANFLILFKFGSTEITPESQGLLARVAAVMRGAAGAEGETGTRFRLVGHTDAAGSPAANLALSRRRAEAVRDYLIKAQGIAADRLEADGKGETELADSAHPTAAANRRVEIITLISPAISPAISSANNPAGQSDRAGERTLSRPPP